MLTLQISKKYFKRPTLHRQSIAMDNKINLSHGRVGRTLEHGANSSFTPTEGVLS